MKSHRVRSAMGATLVVSCLPAIAQTPASRTQVLVADPCASCVSAPDVKVPGGPILMIIAFTLGMVGGVLIGLLVGRTNAKQR